MLRHLLICGSCGAYGYRNDHYCACCGGAMPPCCGDCGAEVVHAVANYCTRCGALLSRDQPSHE